MTDITCQACGKVNTSPTIQFRTTGVEGQSHGGMVYVCGACSMVLGPVRQEEPASATPPRPIPSRTLPVATRSSKAATNEIDALSALASAPQDGDVLTNARQRVRVLNKALKLADRLRKERDALVRLLAAARQPKRTIKSAPTTLERARRLPS